MNPNRKKAIEQLAMRILDHYHIKENPGTHLAAVCTGEDISLMDYSEWDNETCGRFMQIGDEKVIFYNAHHTREMQAFTIAHELGHYFLKHVRDDQPEIICLHRDFQRIDDSKDERLQREVEANYFASCLLLPLHLLTPVFEGFLQRNNRIKKIYVDTQYCNFTDYMKCVNNIRMYFLVSGTAIRFRLINLGVMEFNIQFSPDEDRGISIANYLKRYTAD